MMRNGLKQPYYSGWIRKAAALTLSSMIALSSFSSYGIQASEEPALPQTEENNGSDLTAESTVTVCFDGSSADSGDMDSIAVDGLAAVFTLPENQYVREGYQFSGWSTTADNYDVIQLMVEEDGESEQVVEPAIFIPASIEQLGLPGFSFSYDADMSGQIDEDELFSLEENIADDILTLYPQWEKEADSESEDDWLKDVELKKLTPEDQMSWEQLEQMRENLASASADVQDLKADDSAEEEVSLSDAEKETEEETAESVEDLNLSDSDSDIMPLADGDADEVFKDVSVRWLVNGHPVDDAIQTLQKFSDSSFYVRMRVDVSIQSNDSVEPGSLTLTVPKSIFTDRDGNAAGKMTLAVPEAPDDSASFAYIESEDSYTLVNMVRLPEASMMFFEFTIENLVPHALKSLETGYISDPFFMSAELLNGDGQELSKKSSEIRAEIQTDEKVVGTSVLDNGTYTTLPETWPAEVKAEAAHLDSDHYFFVDWYSSAKITGSQPFSISFTTNPKTEYQSGDLKPIVLGVRYSQEMLYEQEDGSYLLEPSIYLSDGDRFFVNTYVAYPILDPKASEVYHVENDVCYSLVTKDGGKKTQASAAGTSSLSHEIFVKDGGFFDVYKDGIGGDRQEPRKAQAGGGYETGKGYYSFGVNDILNGTNPILNYKIQTLVTGHSFTYDPSYNDESNLEAYGKKKYKVQTKDQALYFNEKINGLSSTSSRLKDDEFRFSSIDVQDPRCLVFGKADCSTPGYKMTDGTPEWTTLQPGEYGYFVTKNRDDYPDLTVMVRLAGQTDYVEAATIRYQTGMSPSVDEKICSYDEKTLIFNADVNVVEFYTEAITSAGGLDWYIYPHVELFASGRVLEEVQELARYSSAPSTTVSNEVQGFSYTEEGKQISYTKIEKGQDVLESAALYATINKTIQNVQTEPDYASMTYKITVSEQSNITDMTVYEKALEASAFPKQTQGVFYDLLPKGVSPVLDSFQLRSGDTIESVSIEENYLNTGRTLVKVKAKLKPRPTYVTEKKGINGLPGIVDSPELTFKAVYSSVSALEFDKTLLNTAAFQSLDGSLGTVDGYKTESDYFVTDTAKNNKTVSAFNIYSGQDKEDVRSVMQQLMNEAEENQKAFLFASNKYSFSVWNMSGLSGFHKAVAVNGSSVYSTGITNENDVYEGGTYSYRLSAMNLNEGAAKGIVFYDELETAVPGSDQNVSDYTAWKGTICSIDLSHIKALGAEPVVYVSHKKDLDLSGISTDRNLDESSIWEKLDKPIGELTEEERKQISVIAIDASKKQDGTDFILAENQMLSAYIKMKAPMVSDIQDDSGKNLPKRAYNEAVVSAYPDKDIAEQTFTSQMTRVDLVPFAISAAKIWSDGSNRDGLRPDAIQVQLVQRSLDGTEKLLENQTAQLSAENGWQSSFENIPSADPNGLPYTYTFRETGLYKNESGQFEERDLSQDYALSIIRTDTSQGILYTLTNTHTPEKVSLNGQKTWVDDNDLARKRSDQITVGLYANGNLKETFVVSEETNWSYSFTGLYKYEKGKEIHYAVKEIDYIPGYISTTDDAELNLTNTYNPYGNLEIINRTFNATEKAKENAAFEYTVHFTDEDGQTVSGEYQYEIYVLDENGKYIKKEESAKTITSGMTITLGIDEKAVIYQLPSETHWSIEEEHQSWFSMTDSKGWTGTIRAGETGEAKFIYTYFSSGVIYLSAEKRVKYHDVVPYLFQFRLLDEDGNVLKTASNDRKNTASFGAVRYSLEDYFDGIKKSGSQTWTVHYRVEEADGELYCYVYDHSYYDVTVNITDNGRGSLLTDVQIEHYSEDEILLTSQIGTAEPMVFENEYQANGTAVLNAWKTLPGRDLQGSDFTFYAYKDGGKVDETWNDENGQINFNLYFSAEDIGKTYQYLIHEEPEPYDPEIVYDTRYMVYDVTVNDSGYGLLTTEVEFRGTKETEDGPINERDRKAVFSNSLSSGTLKVTKAIEGEFDPTKEFNFKIELADANGEPVEPTIPAEGSAEQPFGVEINLINEDGVQEFYQYRLDEDGDVSFQYPCSIPGFDIYAENSTGQRVRIGELTTDAYWPDEIRETLEKNARNQWPSVLSESSEVQDQESKELVEGYPTTFNSFGFTNPFGWNEEFTVIALAKENPNQNEDIFTEAYEYPNGEYVLEWDEESNIWKTELLLISNAAGSIDEGDIEDPFALNLPHVVSMFASSDEKLSLAKIPGIEIEGSIEAQEVTADPISPELRAADTADTSERAAYILNGDTLVFGSEETAEEDGINISDSTVYFTGIDKVATNTFGSTSPDTYLFPWQTNDKDGNRQITKVEFKRSISPICTQGWFWLPKLTEIKNLGLLNTSQTTDMKNMFRGLEEMKELDISMLDLTSAKFAENMIRAKATNNASLEKVKLPEKVFPNTVKLEDLFTDQSKLVSIETPTNCTTLEINNPIVNASHRRLFVNCSALKTIGIKEIRLINPIGGNNGSVNLSQIFSGCSSLTEEDLPAIEILNENNKKFNGINLGSLYTGTHITRFDFSKLKLTLRTDDCANLYEMFQNCTALTFVKIPHMNGLGAVYELFSGCTALEQVVFEENSIAWSSSTDSYVAYNSPRSMFAGCSSLKSVDLSQVSMVNAIGFQEMFKDCVSLTEVKWFKEFGIVSQAKEDLLHTTNKGSLKNLLNSNAFAGCTSLEKLDITTLSFEDDTKDLLNKLLVDLRALKELKIGSEDEILNQLFLPQYNRGDEQDDLSYTGRWKNTENEIYVQGGSGLLAPYKGVWIREESPTVWTVVFDGNGGLITMDSVSGNITDKTLAIPTPTYEYRFGYELLGFAADPNEINQDVIYQSGDVVTDLPYLGGQTYTWYAIWEKKDTNIDFEMGVATFTLHGNESISFTLDGGTRYSVYEETEYGWTLVSSQGEKGMIEPLQTANAIFVNQFTPNLLPVSISAQKRINGVDLPGTNTFEFVLSADEEGKEIIETQQNSSSGQIVFSPLSISDVGEYTYYIHEVIPEEITSDEQTDSSSGKFDYDTRTFQADFEVIRDDESQQLKLKNGIVYSSNGETITGEAIFNNIAIPEKTYQLRIKKLVVEVFGEKPESDYRSPLFHFILTKENGETYDIDLSHGGEMTIGGLKAGESYFIEEAAIPDGYTVTEILYSGVIEPKEINEEDRTNYVEIHSVYDGYGELMLQADKTLVGESLQGNDFEFQVTNEGNEEIAGPFTNTKDGKIFVEIPFYKPGKYRYFLSEIQEDNNLYEYDSSKKELNINVWDEGAGKLKAQLDSDPTQPETSLTFENKMKPGSLRISKTVDSSSQIQIDHHFNFTVSLSNPSESNASLDGEYPVRYGLLDESKDQQEENQNAEIEFIDGVANFTLSDRQYIEILNLPHGTHFDVEEELQDGYEQTHKNQTGDCISAGTVQEVDFVNEWHGSLSWQLMAVKTLTGRELKDGDFSFYFIDEQTGTQTTVKNKADGTVTFAPLEFTAEDLGKTFLYRVGEINDQQESISYDDHEYLISLVPEVNSSAIMEMKASILKTDDEGNPIEDEDDQYQILEALNQPITFNNYVEYSFVETGQLGMAPGMIGAAGLIALCGYDLLKRKTLRHSA